MNIALFLKNNLRNIPPEVGTAINCIPYGLRPGIGKIYKARKAEISYFANATSEEMQHFVFSRIKRLIDFAYKNVKFYREFYDSKGFSTDDLRSFSDISHVPIVTKSILNQYDIEDRSFSKNGRYQVNTGGSSGTPFTLYIEPSSMAHEWAHIHTIWNRLAYKPWDLKLVFGGRSDLKSSVEYDVVRNHFAVDIYASFDEVAEKLEAVLRKHRIKYLHGYPSSIYDFAVYCDQQNPKLRNLLRENLKGAFLGSEYPHKHYRDTIEKVFDIPSISWYGHTERAVLAYEKNKAFQYEPFLTYGFAEGVANKIGETELVSTSYYNFSSPLIRYNTEDVIERPVVQEGILRSFLILEGRSGEFVLDKDGKKINLTGLIFGRHHEIFNQAKFIQVEQVSKGAINVYYVAEIDEAEASLLFDSGNLNLDIRFVKSTEPVRSPSGKVSLLIK